MISRSRLTLGVAALVCFALSGATAQEQETNASVPFTRRGNREKLRGEECAGHDDCGEEKFCDFDQECLGCELCFDDDTVDGFCPEKCAGTSPGCSKHDDCFDNHFCMIGGECWNCEECLDEGAIDGACPVKCDDNFQCSTHEDCGVGFCTYDRMCDECKFCTREDSIDGVCPRSCRVRASQRKLRLQATRECFQDTHCKLHEYCSSDFVCRRCDECFDSGEHCPDHCSSECEPFDLFMANTAHELNGDEVGDSALAPPAQATNDLRAPAKAATQGYPLREANVATHKRNVALFDATRDRTYNCSVGFDVVNGSDVAPYGTECDVANFCGEGYSPLMGMPAYLCTRDGWEYAGLCAKYCHAPAILLENSSITGLNCTNWFTNARYVDLSKPVPVGTHCEASCEGGAQLQPNHVDSSFRCKFNIGALIETAGRFTSKWIGQPVCEPDVRALP